LTAFAIVALVCGSCSKDELRICQKVSLFRGVENRHNCYFKSEEQVIIYDSNGFFSQTKKSKFKSNIEFILVGDEMLSNESLNFNHRIENLLNDKFNKQGVYFFNAGIRDVILQNYLNILNTIRSKRRLKGVILYIGNKKLISRTLLTKKMKFETCPIFPMILSMQQHFLERELTLFTDQLNQLAESLKSQGIQLTVLVNKLDTFDRLDYFSSYPGCSFFKRALSRDKLNADKIERLMQSNMYRIEFGNFDFGSKNSKVRSEAQSLFIKSIEGLIN
jgi:hypothetical protein